MDEVKKERIKKFVNDKLMSSAVREVFTSSFLKPRGDKDIHTLAASRIAIDLLDEAFKELSRFSMVEEKPSKNLTNIAV